MSSKNFLPSHHYPPPHDPNIANNFRTEHKISKALGCSYAKSKNFESGKHDIFHHWKTESCPILEIEIYEREQFYSLQLISEGSTLEIKENWKEEIILVMMISGECFNFIADIDHDTKVFLFPV